MLEFIGLIVVIWIVYVLIRSFLKVNSTIRSREFGKEARYVAINELNVPEAFYNYSILNHMDEIKQAALQLKEHDDYRGLSWSRQMAWVIYGAFRHECELWQLGQQKLNIELRIPVEVIVSELNREKLSLAKESVVEESTQCVKQNYLVTKTGFTVKDSETGHILAAKYENKMFYGMVIMPEQDIQLPLQPWKSSNSPFSDEFCFKGNQTGYSENGQWWFHIEASSSFSEIMVDVESLN